MKPYGIVGFDPGNTCAVAIVDFDGNVIFLGSYAIHSPEQVVGLVRERCVPSLFASDVAPAQEPARKLATSFGCRCWEPELSLSIADKKRVVFENYEGAHDVHERDALAAALFCLFSITPLIERAKRKSPEGWEERLHMVLRGDAINLSEERKEAEEILAPARTKAPDYLTIRRLKERILRMEARETALGLKLEKSERELERERKKPVQRTIEKVVVENKKILGNLSKELEIAKRVMREAVGRKLVILPMGKPTGGAIYVRDARALSPRFIFESKIRVVVSEIPADLPCKVVRLAWQSLFGREFAIIPADELETTREEDRLWGERYLDFLSRKP